jgi:Domain of Unknown Function (DUF1206)
VPPPKDPSPPTSARTRRFRRLARVGHLVNGGIHLLIGIAALTIAFGDKSGRRADQVGILSGLSTSAGGRVLLWIAVVGLGALGLWQITQALFVREPEIISGGSRRVSEAGKGIVYLGLSALALFFAFADPARSAGISEGLASRFLGGDVGGFALIVTGATVFGFGVGFVIIGCRRTFRKLIRVPGGRGGTLVVAAGLIGYVAEGIALLLVGLSFAAAGVFGSARRTFGLDSVFRSLDALPSGAFFLTVFATALILYAIFLIARAKIARL